MEYSVGDKIIFDKKYVKNKITGNYRAKDTRGWIEPWLIGRVATITEKRKAELGNWYWYYIDIPNTHGYDEALFNKFEETENEEMLVEL